MLLLGIIVCMIFMALFGTWIIIGPILAGLIGGLIAGGGGGRGALTGFLSGFLIALVLAASVYYGVGFAANLINSITDRLPREILYGIGGGVEGALIIIIGIVGLYLAFFGMIGGAIGGAVRGKKPTVQMMNTSYPQSNTHDDSRSEIIALNREIAELRQQIRDLKAEQSRFRNSDTRTSSERPPVTKEEQDWERKSQYL